MIWAVILDDSDADADPALEMPTVEVIFQLKRHEIQVLLKPDFPSATSRNAAGRQSIQ